MSKGAIAGIVVGGAFGILLLAFILYIMFYTRKKVAEVTLLPVPGGAIEDQYSQLQHGIYHSALMLTHLFISFFKCGYTFYKASLIEFP
jgi:hypothetical protein